MHMRAVFFAVAAQGNVVEIRSIPVPAHRYTPLKNHWDEIMTPLIEHLHLLIRFNPRKRAVELKVCLSIRSTLRWRCRRAHRPFSQSPLSHRTLMLTATRLALLSTDERAYHRANCSAKG